jgi:hypothetical protein
MELLDATEKTSVTPPGIDPGTFQLVVQCLNQYATPGPLIKCMIQIINMINNHPSQTGEMLISNPNAT